MEPNFVVFGRIMCLHGVDLREFLCQYKKLPASDVFNAQTEGRALAHADNCEPMR